MKISIATWPIINFRLAEIYTIFGRKIYFCNMENFTV